MSRGWNKRIRGEKLAPDLYTLEEAREVLRLQACRERGHHSRRPIVHFTEGDLRHPVKVECPDCKTEWNMVAE